MKNRSARSCWTLMAVLSAASSAFAENPASAASFSAAVPGLTGSVSMEHVGEKFTFDFGREFADISRVWIEVEATATPYEWDQCGTVFDPQPCVHHVQFLELGAILEEESFPEPGIFLARVGPFGNVPLQDQGDFCRNSCEERKWEFLLDGDGALELSFGVPIFLPEDIVINGVYPVFEVAAATVVIDAISVPEPKTDALAGAALLSLFLARHRFRRGVRR